MPGTTVVNTPSTASSQKAGQRQRPSPKACIRALPVTVTKRFTVSSRCCQRISGSTTISTAKPSTVASPKSGGDWRMS